MEGERIEMVEVFERRDFLESRFVVFWGWNAIFLFYQFYIFWVFFLIFDVYRGIDFSEDRGEKQFFVFLRFRVIVSVVFFGWVFGRYFDIEM